MPAKNTFIVLVGTSVCISLSLYLPVARAVERYVCPSVCVGEKKRQLFVIRSQNGDRRHRMSSQIKDSLNEHIDTQEDCVAMRNRLVNIASDNGINIGTVFKTRIGPQPSALSINWCLLSNNVGNLASPWLEMSFFIGTLAALNVKPFIHLPQYSLGAIRPRSRLPLPAYSRQDLRGQNKYKVSTVSGSEHFHKVDFEIVRYIKADEA